MLQLHISKEQIEQEIKRSQPLAPGWHEFELTEVAAIQAKDKQSMNYVVTHTLVSDPARTILHYFNSKPFGQTFVLKLFAAVNGLTVNEFLSKLDKEFDLTFDNVKGKKVMGKVVHNLGTDANAGKIFNNLEDWAPLGKVPF